MGSITDGHSWGLHSLPIPREQRIIIDGCGGASQYDGTCSTTAPMLEVAWGHAPVVQQVNEWCPYADDAGYLCNGPAIDCDCPTCYKEADETCVFQTTCAATAPTNLHGMQDEYKTTVNSAL